jgi:hypothetical protein
MRPTLLVPMAFALASCASPEWRQANNNCSARLYNEIPPSFTQVVVQKTRLISVPNGNVTCHTFGSTFGYGYSGTTNCTQGTHLESIPYTDVETIDLNQARRDSAIQSCTANACVQQYGNADCKPAGQKPFTLGDLFSF